jgi:glyoxylate reductase
MSRLRIFVTQPVAESALARLRAVAEVEVNPDSSKIISKADLCAAVARSDILYALLHDRIDREVLAANPKLRAVNAMVITPDQIDVAEATRRKIPVTNIPAIVTDATADLCFASSRATGCSVPASIPARSRTIWPAPPSAARRSG